MTHSPPVVPLTLSAEEAAIALGISRRSVDRAIARGEIRAVRIGGRVVIPRGEIARVLGLGAVALDHRGVPTDRGPVA